MLVEGLQQRTKPSQCIQSIQSHGIKALEDVAIFPMFRDTTVLVDTLHDLLEAGDDARFLVCAPARGRFLVVELQLAGNLGVSDFPRGKPDRFGLSNHWSSGKAL